LKKNLSLILGSLFILTSGLIFTIERLISHIYWLAKMNTGSYNIEPQSIPLFNNIFISVFLMIGIIFIIVHFEKRKQ